MTMSAKKDAIVNMGGFTAYKDEDLFRKAVAFNIIYEGYINIWWHVGARYECTGGGTL